MPKYKHLYRLHSYCIENYLIIENALIELCHSKCHGLTYHQIKQSLRFKDWIEKNSALYQKLFVWYGIKFLVRRKQIEPEKSNWIGHLTDESDNHNLSEESVLNKIMEIKKVLQNIIPDDEIEKIGKQTK